MDHPKEEHPSAAAPRPAAVKKLTTLLDAYEVECIRLQLERLLLKQNAGAGELASSDAAAEAHSLHHHYHHSEKTGAKNANLAQASAPPPAKKRSGGGGVRLLGRHAVAICSGAATVSSAGSTGRRLRRRRGYREVEKV